jgi:hypothetical protein
MTGICTAASARDDRTRVASAAAPAAPDDNGWQDWPPDDSELPPSFSIPAEGGRHETGR